MQTGVFCVDGHPKPTNNHENGISFMLILSRKESECIHLGDDIIVTVVRVNGDKVRIGVQAPPHIKILRTELELNWTEQPSSVSQSAATERNAIRRAA